MKEKSHQRKALLITVLMVLLPMAWLSRSHWMPWLESLHWKEKPEQTSTTKRPTSSKVGKTMDAFNGVDVYYNGKVSSVHGRNTTKDGYNLGLRYQCVEYVKRYYFERFGHKMPDSYGHAREFFDASVRDGGFNQGRALRQFTNPSRFPPSEEAIIVYGPTPYNAFGHVAIVTDVKGGKVSCIAQNLGIGNGTRRTYSLKQNGDGLWQIDEPYILGWLSK